MTVLPYDIALALKEAGWPQIYGTYVCTDGSCVLWSPDKPSSIAYSPSLSELTEACPKELTLPGYLVPSFFRLVWNPDSRCFEAGYARHESFDGEPGKGAMPEVALSNLWLALKKEGKV